MATGLSQYTTRAGKTYLTRQEEADLWNRIQQGDNKARDELVLRHYPLVQSVAGRFVRQYAAKEELKDLVQEGYCGLLEATKRFNPTIARFGTYARWWVTVAIRDYLVASRGTVKVPQKLQREMAIARAVMQKFLRQRGHTPTVAELADMLHLPIEHVVELVVMMGESTVRLDATALSDSTDTLSDIIPDNKSLTPEQQYVARQELERTVKRIDFMREKINALPERDQKIMILLGDLDQTGKKCTLQEVGDLFEISPERVRQLAVRAWAKVAGLEYSSREQPLDHLFDRIQALTELVSAAQ